MSWSRGTCDIMHMLANQPDQISPPPAHCLHRELFVYPLAAHGVFLADCKLETVNSGCSSRDLGRAIKIIHLHSQFPLRRVYIFGRTVASYRHLRAGQAEQVDRGGYCFCLIGSAAGIDFVNWQEASVSRLLAWLVIMGEQITVQMFVRAGDSLRQTNDDDDFLLPVGLRDARLALLRKPQTDLDCGWAEISEEHKRVARLINARHQPDADWPSARLI